MDTITQITLGAAVGEAALGKKMGNKAPLWGAFLGIVPDLDVLVTPFVSEVEALSLHRGLTHSLLFCALAAPVIGLLLNRWYSDKRVGPYRWSWMVFGVLITHVGIDLCTTYGTQILQPFSDQLFSFNSIFIIDPFYTLPLMGGIITALFMRRTSSQRRWANYIGIGLSSLYLLAGLAIKTHINTVFEQNFEQQNIKPTQYMTTPTPFNIALWSGYAVEGDTLYAGLYSIFDEDRRIQFQSVPQNKQLLTPFRGQLPVERLLWFAQGYFTVEKKYGNLLVHDIRFGRSDLWLKEQPAPFVWNYKLQFEPGMQKTTGFRRFEPGFSTRTKLWGPFLDRVLGEE